uniref:Uncharacterized protein n=1 Tax=Glossina palpalis gambiensis TaxID=67801 RepID=A0A1B0AZ27_9MUSC
MLEEFIDKLPNIDSDKTFEDFSPMEKMIVSTSLGSIALRRDDEYRNRIMRSKSIQPLLFLPLTSFIFSYMYIYTSIYV